MAVAPRLTELVRVSRQSRRRTPRTRPQYPGYIFIAPGHEQVATDDRWRLRTPNATGCAEFVPPSVLEHALWLEQHSAQTPMLGSRSSVLRPGDRVVLSRGPLVSGVGAMMRGEVADSRGPRLVVLLDGCPFPVVCSPDQLDPE